LRIVDSETGQERELTVTPDVLQAYSREMQTFSDRIQRHCLRYRLGYLRTVTDFPFEDLVLEVFRQGRFLK
jgi:hypothetical protein